MAVVISGGTVLSAAVIPHGQGPLVPAYSTAEGGRDRDVVEILEQWRTFSQGHIGKVDSIDGVDPQGFSAGDGMCANDRMDHGRRFFRRISDCHTLQVVFEFRLGPVGARGAMDCGHILQ